MLLETTYSFNDYASAILVLLILVAWLYIKHRIQSRKIYQFAFFDEILILTAYIINTDGSAGKKELTFIKKYLAKEYGEETSKKFITLLYPILNKKKPIKSALAHLNYNESESTLIHLLNFLIRITIIDGYLKIEEYNGLLIICKGLGLPRLRLDSMLSMYTYIYEGDQKNQSKTNQKRTQLSKLKQAYTILELKETATIKEVKKSYRKLVILYHPDKLTDHDEKFKNGAKEKFQKINDAYDFLKEVKGFK